MARGNPVIYADFSGGLNTQGAPYLLSETQCRDSRNVHTSPLGSIKKRNGFVTLNDSSLTSRLDTAHSLFPVNTSTKSLLVVGKQAGASNDRIVSVSTGGVATTLKSGLVQAQRWEWVMAPTSGGQGPIYGMNGNLTDTPQYWDGAAASTTNWVASSGTVPNGKYMAYHGTRIWVAGVAAQPSRLYYSGFSGSAPDPLNWDASNFVDLEPNDGEAITGIGTCGPYLLVFKQHKAFRVHDLASGANTRISSEVGCTAHRTIQEGDKGCFFFSDDHGVCVTNGDTVSVISNDIDDVITTVASSPTTMVNACAAFRENNYHLSVSVGGSVNDALLEYDTATESWWRHSIASNQFGLLDPQGSPKLYSVAPSASVARVHQAYVANTYADEGSPYSGGTYWTGPYYVWDAPQLRKRVHQFRVDGIGTWMFSAATNFTESFANVDGEAWDPTDTGGTFGGSGTFGGTGTFGPTAGTTERRYYTPGVGRAWSVKFTNDDSSDFEIFSMTALIRERAD